MMRWVEVLAELLNRVAKIVERLWYMQRQEKRQEKADKAASDPAGALADHFGGRMRKLSDKAPEAGKADD